MSISTLLVLVILTCLTLLCLWVCFSRRLWVLGAPEYVANMKSLLFPENDSFKVVDANSWGYTLAVPKKKGTYWINGQQIDGIICYAYVPIGFIAKLPAINQIKENVIFSKDEKGNFLENKDKSDFYTDKSQFCFFLEDSSIEEGDFLKIELLQKNRRWQILIDNKQNIRTKNRDIPILAHISIHTEIIEEKIEGINDTFRASTKDYETAIETLVTEVLRAEAQNHDYKWFVLNAEALILKFQEKWDHNEDYVKFREAYNTSFNGFVIKTIISGEKERLKNVLKNLSTKKDLPRLLNNIRLGWQSQYFRKSEELWQRIIISVIHNSDPEWEKENRIRYYGRIWSLGGISDNEGMERIGGFIEANAAIPSAKKVKSTIDAHLKTVVAEYTNPDGADDNVILNQPRKMLDDLRSAIKPWYDICEELDDLRSEISKLEKLSRESDKIEEEIRQKLLRATEI